MVAGEVDLTAAEHDGERGQDPAASAAADDQVDEAGPGRGGARRSTPLATVTDDDADMEVTASVTPYNCATS